MTQATVLPQMTLVGTAAITAGTTQTQAGATLITAQASVVTTGNASDGVILPPSVPGQVFVIRNASANALKLYPSSGGALNAASADASITLAASKSAVGVFTTTTNAEVVQGA